MPSFTYTIIQCYETVRKLILNLTERNQSPNKQKNRVLSFDNVNHLSNAFFSREVGIGDNVQVSGWLSPYTYWHLPEAYLPYRFESAYIAYENRQAMKMAPAPALIPVGRIPFQTPDRHLCFLYLSDKRCLDLELSQPKELSIREPRISMLTADDQPWLFNLDTGTANYSPNPLAWIYQFGDTNLAASIQQNPDTTQVILTDPRRVHEIVDVPERCRMIPVWLPKDHPTSGFVKIQGQIRELDHNVLTKLSGLGAPLSERLYSNFYKVGHPAFCIDSQKISNTSTQAIPSPHGIHIVEFFFEDIDTKTIITINDSSITDWLIPCIKDFVIHYEGGYVFPDRWVGKVYGFNGPIYFYKTGTIELSISLSGLFTLQVRTDVFSEDNVFINHWISFFRGFTKRVSNQFTEKFKRSVVHRTTFLTEPSLQITFGPLLDGAAFDQLRTSQSLLKNIRQEIQDIKPTTKLLRIEDIDQFSGVQSVPRSSITSEIENIIRNLNEREELEPLLRYLLVDTTETPHGSTEIADILTTHVTIAGNPKLTAFVNKGKATQKVTAREVTHQITRLRTIPGLNIISLVAVGDIYDDIKRDLLGSAEDAGCDYLIIDRIDIARLFIAAGRICQEHVRMTENGECSVCQQQ